MYLFGQKISETEKKRNKTKDTVVISDLNMEKKTIYNDINQYYKSWVQDHQDSPFSIAVIYLCMQDYDIKTLKTLYDSLSEKAKSGNLVINALPYYFAKKKTDERFAIGSTIKDFVLNDTANQNKSFHELKDDNYVLLDIWASWCSPCIKSVPQLKRLLEKYNDKNFKIIGISADESKKDWTQAITVHQMSWIQLSGLKGTGAGYMADNFISIYPTYILVSPKGEILAKPDNIERVEELSQISFKNEMY